MEEKHNKPQTKPNCEKSNEEKKMGRMLVTTRDKKNVCMCACVKEKQGTKKKTQKSGECDSEREMGRMPMTTRDKKGVCVCV
jgi:hypothetical protein